jgi:hypothetical protein
MFYFLVLAMQTWRVFNVQDCTFSWELGEGWRWQVGGKANCQRQWARVHRFRLRQRPARQGACMRCTAPERRASLGRDGQKYGCVWCTLGRRCGLMSQTKKVTQVTYPAASMLGIWRSIGRFIGGSDRMARQPVKLVSQVVMCDYSSRDTFSNQL